MIKTTNLISALLLTLPQESNTFCNDVNLYACKELGITKCVPKTERCGLDVNCSENPFPIEKAACKQNCTGSHSWCEQRGKCINQKEKCDCGPDKIYCTTKGTYSCENRIGVDESRIFRICPDGTCMGDCSETESNTNCHQGQFKCGKQCKNKKEIASFRDCEDNCIPASDLCFFAATIATPSDAEIELKILVLILAALTLLLISIFIYKNWEDLIILSNLSELERELSNGYREKLQQHQTNNDPENNSEAVGDLDANTYEQLMEIIKTHKANVLKQLVTLLKPLQHEDVQAELLQKTDVHTMKEDVRKFISGGCVQVIKTEDPKANNWICDGDDKNQGCYCLVCLIAGVSNEFTLDPGAAPTETNKKAHLYVSTQHSREVATKDNELESMPLCFEDPDTDSMIEYSGLITEIKLDSHSFAGKIINEVQQFSDEMIKSRSIFSLILYEQKKVIAVILKAVQVIEKTEAQCMDESKWTRDIYIPLGLLEVKSETQPLSLTEEMRKLLSAHKIKLIQISSISSVYVDGVLPSMSVSVCETFCTLPETECICLHSIIKTQEVKGELEKIEDPHLVIVHRVLNALTFILSQTPQGYDTLTKMQRENKEPVITEDMFRCLRHTSLKVIIQFVRTCPKSIQATLLKIKNQMYEPNETNENKQRVAVLLNAMEKFSTKATTLLREIVLDAYEEVFQLLRDPHPNWDSIKDTVKKQITTLEKITEKDASDALTTVELGNSKPICLQEFDCLKVGEYFKEDVVSTDYISNCLIGSNFVDNNAGCKKRMSNVDALNDLTKKAKENTMKKDIDLFIKFKNKFICTAIKNLQSNFPEESIIEIKAVSKVLITKGTNKPMKILLSKFSTMSENKNTVKEFEELKKIKKNASHMDIKTFSSHLVANHYDDVPNLAFLAEVYLNLILDSRQLQQLFLDIDKAVNISRPRLNFEEKNKKLLVAIMKSTIQLEEKAVGRGGGESERLSDKNGHRQRKRKCHLGINGIRGEIGTGRRSRRSNGSS